MKWDSSEREEADKSLQHGLGDADERRGQRRADGRAQELREGQDAAGENQNDECSDESVG